MKNEINNKMHSIIDPDVFFNQYKCPKNKNKRREYSVLKDETTINVGFVYDGMSVDSFSDENEYIKKSWVEVTVGRRHGLGDRKTRFEPKFKELFEEYSKMLVKDLPNLTLLP
ncbi:MAG: hypothetical protein JJE22_19515 [Bacteroidia bacterium]|nr:hypothetical protein [Bacteroidia bacterium]